MQESVEGIVVREKDYGESSKIIDIITIKYGLISVISKGSKKIKSSLSGVSSKLTYGVFHIYYKENKLSTLISVDVINNFREIKRDIIKIGYATYLCELVEQVVKQINSKIEKEEIYNIFSSSILKINEGFDSMVITNIVELKLLDYLGVKPVINECIMCGNKTDILTLSADKGGLLCIQCNGIEKNVDSKTIKFIRMLYYVDISKISKLDVSNIVKKEINDFMNEYYDKHTGLYLKSKTFLSNIYSSKMK